MLTVRIAGLAVTALVLFGVVGVRGWLDWDGQTISVRIENDNDSLVMKAAPNSGAAVR